MSDRTSPPSLPASLSLTIEGGGFVLSCSACGWVRFNATRPDADAQIATHGKTCKPKVERAERAATGPRAVAWDDREGATWIDKL